VPYQATVQVVKTGGVSNADIDGNNILQINAIEVAISTFKQKLPLLLSRNYVL
jgi:hypothetical protein